MAAIKPKHKPPPVQSPLLVAIRSLERIGWESPTDLLLIAASAARMVARKRGPDDPVASVSRILEAVWHVTVHQDAKALEAADTWARSYLDSRCGSK